MVDVASFRTVLGYYPTGVCVITSVEPDGQPIGMTIGSFTSVSLVPPLVAFLPGRQSSTWQRIRATGRFCVNVLGDQQEAVCRRFASPASDKFDGIDYRLSDAGLPIIENVVAWIDCDIESVHEAGDHFIAIGRVEALSAGEAGRPLVFHRGSYSQVSPLMAAA